MKKTTLFALIALGSAILLGSFAYRAHYRLVTEGEFLGLPIGASKIEVVILLTAKGNVSGVDPRVPSIHITSENIAEIIKLREHRAFVVKSPHGISNIYLGDENVKLVHSYLTPDWAKDDLSSVDELIVALSKHLKANPEDSIDAVRYPLQDGQPFFVTMTKDNRPTQQRLEWLFGFDHWVFKEDNRWTLVDLYFDDQLLKEIEYRNFFMEPP